MGLWEHPLSTTAASRQKAMARIDFFSIESPSLSKDLIQISVSSALFRSIITETDGPVYGACSKIMPAILSAVTKRAGFAAHPVFETVSRHSVFFFFP